LRFLADQGTYSPSLLRRRSRRESGPSIAIAIAAIILLASIPAGHLSFSPRATAPRPASMGFSAAQIGAAVTSNPTYDEQIGATFTQNLNALTFNVTALAQTDADGYGPAYTLNGLTTADYWYQVGISYHWPSSSGTYDPGFGFSYQVYGPNGKSVYPTGGGAGLGTFSKAVHSGDNVLLSLTFTGSSIQMLAQDWETGATAKASYSSVGSSTFVGNPSNPANSQGFFSGLMTEWYHVSLYSGNEGKVTYTNQPTTLTSAWLWVDEFDTGSSGPPVFINQTQTPVTFTNEQQIYPFFSDGATIYGSAHQFITGLLDTAASQVTLTPAVAEAASPSFLASYTLAGLQQSTGVAAGIGTMVEADPGTSITLTVNSSASSPLDRWVFNGTSGTEVIFAAGTNATYVYYHLVQEALSVQVVSPGASLPSFPTLTYEVPWPNPVSSSPAQVTATQVLSTTPDVIFALLGSTASISGVIPASVGGERWAIITQNWTISAPDVIPSPIQYYQQYQVTAAYSIVGGGTPPEMPEFTSTAFGNPTTFQISGPFVIPSCPEHGCTSFPAGLKTSWSDVGSGFSFTGVLNGSSRAERWTGSEANGSAPSISPGAVLSEAYTHQYYADIGTKDPNGGSTSPESGWLNAGSTLSATASANQGWQFETWNGSGAAAYTGTSPSIDINVTAPLTENATFYVQLAVSADAGTNIAYSYGSETGTVQSGSTKTLYIPPSSNVTLQATPSVFVYSFASWQGAGMANATKPSLALVVDSPTAVTGASSYNLTLVLGGAATAAIILLLAASLWIRTRRRRVDLGGFIPGAILR